MSSLKSVGEFLTETSDDGFWFLPVKNSVETKVVKAVDSKKVFFFFLSCGRFQGVFNFFAGVLDPVVYNCCCLSLLHLLWLAPVLLPDNLTSI